MSFIRNLIRRWLGIPSPEDIRAMILREIDADAAWREREADGIVGPSLLARRLTAERERGGATIMGLREDTCAKI